jgi:hypothetical protein
MTIFKQHIVFLHFNKLTALAARDFAQIFQQKAKQTQRRVGLQEAAYFLLGKQSDFSPVAVGFGVVAELLGNHDGAA